MCVVAGNRSISRIIPLKMALGELLAGFEGSDVVRFLPDALTTYRPAYELQYPFGWQFLPLGERTVESPPVEIECVDALSDPRLW